jgi:hypothetical protein
MGRDPRLRPIVARYKPPEGLTPAEVGTLVDDSADMADVTATIVDLAVRGVLRIEENKLGDGYTFVLLKRPDEWTGLKPHEEALLNGLFGDFTSLSVSTAELENISTCTCPPSRVTSTTRCVDRGYYRIRPDRVRFGASRAGLTIGVLTAFGGSWLSGVFGMAPLPFIISGIATAIIIIVFGRILPARTPRGARALEEVLGFEEFHEPRRRRSLRTERSRRPRCSRRSCPSRWRCGSTSAGRPAFASVYLQAAELVQQRRIQLRPLRFQRPSQRHVEFGRIDARLLAPQLRQLGRLRLQRRQLGRWWVAAVAVAASRAWRRGVRAGRPQVRRGRHGRDGRGGMATIRKPQMNSRLFDGGAATYVGAGVGALVGLGNRRAGVRDHRGDPVERTIRPTTSHPNQTALSGRLGDDGPRSSPARDHLDDADRHVGNGGRRSMKTPGCVRGRPP